MSYKEACNKCEFWIRTEAPEQIMGTCDNKDADSYGKRRHGEGYCYSFVERVI